jgi:hypothetical protein
MLDRRRQKIAAHFIQWIKFSLFAGLLALCHPSQGEAVPIVGAPIIVPLSGNIVTTYLGNSALFSNDLYLQSPDGAYTALIYNNHSSPPGTEVNLGFFAAGTELVFRLHVADILLGQNFDYYSGAGTNNVDGLAHARVDTQYSINQTLVEFEDLYGTPEGQYGFNDLIFSLRAVANDSSPLQAPTSVPEPAAQSLLLLGLLFIGIIPFKRSC